MNLLKRKKLFSPKCFLTPQSCLATICFWK